MKKLYLSAFVFWGGTVVLCAADPLPLSIASREYPHMESIRNGSIQIPECRISYSTMSLGEMDRRLELGSAGDIIEVDIFSYLKRFDSEDQHNWTLVPVYLWREFPHGHVKVQTGGRLALDTPNRSLLVWATGILESSPTFKPAGIWDQRLSTSGAHSPMFTDPKSVEQEYFKSTRIFPIITALAVRKELVDANPWLPEAIFIAFAEAKSRALEEGSVPLPWGPQYRDETIELMKKDYWSYGIQNNPKTLSALFKYAHAQGLTRKELNPDEVFSLETLQLIDEKGAKN